VRRSIAVALFILAALVAASTAATAAPGDVARYIIAPGNFGGVPTNENSLDQLRLYDALTPKRGRVTRRDINRLFLPENFKPIGRTRVERTGRRGLRLVYDSYGVPHIYGKTRADMAFGAGWASARDRGLLLRLGRGPARVAVADVPGIDAFGLVTSGQSFVPSAETEALVTEQRRLLVSEYGAKGRQIIADARAYAAGITAYFEANDIDERPATVNDILSVTAFIGSIFGAGGGGEADNADLLGRLREELGRERGQAAWEDVMLADDPEAPTTIGRRFDYGPLTGGRVRGSVALDPGTIQAFNPRVTAGSARVDAASAPPRRQASNFLNVAPKRSRTSNPLAVMGPQLGYFYPAINYQVHLRAPGIDAQGAAVPGLAMYLLLGRTKNYAWSLTSANHDVRDVYAEELCEPSGAQPTRASTYYRYKGRCRSFSDHNAGLLGGQPLRYKGTVHGSVIGTALVGGKPYALARKRSTFGRDALNLATLKDLTEGKGNTPRRFWRAANQFGFTFNWGYASRRATAFFTSGRLPERAPGLDRRLPTLGTGNFEWRGYLSEREHPHAVSGPGGLLLNWNNRSAPGFMHGDDEPYGSVQRVELYDRYPRRVTIEKNVGVMNRAATEDLRSPVWPVVSEVLRTGQAPNARAQQVVDILDSWVRRDAPRLDADENGFYDSPGPTIMDEAWERIADAVMAPVFNTPALLEALGGVRNLAGPSGHSYVDKDLRTLLRRRVRGRFNLRYCGNGSLAACRASLWAAISSTANDLAAAQNQPDPRLWRSEANRTDFAPGLIPTTFRTTNRSVFQQVLEFARPRR
jgi:acyl-homoserine lactone acylase PvdQ